MTHAAYVATAWGVTLGACGIYALHVVRRGRSLARRVAPERRRWMTADTDDGSTS